MDLTTSFDKLFPADVLQRYDFREIRNAAAILKATNPSELDEVVQTLQWLWLDESDIKGAGGSKSDLAKRLDNRFRELGWREGRHDTSIESVLRLMPHRPAQETEARVVRSEVFNEGYKVDNVKSRVALDVEWNAKDGNLDRDIGAYRALYDAGIIDAGVLITRTQADLRDLAKSLDASSTKFGTSTTTNLEKLEPRLTRGDSGGCPVLAIAITGRCLRP
ncbi:MAG: BglII/BstYI family type II restriction endonuclease [Planctomycetota bacterium]